MSSLHNQWNIFNRIRINIYRFWIRFLFLHRPLAYMYFISKNEAKIWIKLQAKKKLNLSSNLKQWLITNSRIAIIIKLKEKIKPCSRKQNESIIYHQNVQWKYQKKSNLQWKKTKTKCIIESLDRSNKIRRF